MSLANLSDSTNMSGARPLGERSANIPAKSGVKSTDDKPKSGKKRKSDEPAINPDDIELPEYMPIEWTPNQIRAKIRQFVNSGEMKVGEFQDKIGISANSYSRFLGQNGQKGAESDTYTAAHDFFKRRELAGLKMPRQKKAKTDTTEKSKSADKTSDTNGKTDDKKSKTKSKKEEQAEIEARNDVSGIHLHGDENDNVSVYDTCDDIRTKINKYLRDTPHATNASFVREVNRALGEDSSRHTAAQGLSRFLGNKGPGKGAESTAFYAAYVFFEKLRIKQGKPKSKKRLDMEDEWARQGGFPLRDQGKGILAPAGARVTIDKYGKYNVEGRGRY
ncbi:hypothetical protein LTR10_024043 [Elasticomyces elasticus]|uniref:DUF7726 domain-containing protein n=1 Tax=Exophiala sideris TaxID=1016849 RepID=A0ABR0J6N2_9EURO|nr:hypothetical protein LTR10_024043 [Elasticomyces elasticus]KAK5028939.1 hypothetical protein LTS07_006320 [Exophiala sideris]KAK5035808.1 hypothetical protein LTR13_005939 [Exophiala sideris]KAK5057443.1 hypothetical protein LTR69_007484 [Exophiala sideris]